MINREIDGGYSSSSSYSSNNVSDTEIVSPVSSDNDFEIVSSESKTEQAEQKNSVSEEVAKVDTQTQTMPIADEKAELLATINDLKEKNSQLTSQLQEKERTDKLEKILSIPLQKSYTEFKKFAFLQAHSAARVIQKFVRYRQIMKTSANLREKYIPIRKDYKETESKFLNSLEYKKAKADMDTAAKAYANHPFNNNKLIELQRSLQNTQQLIKDNAENVNKSSALSLLSAKSHEWNWISAYNLARSKAGSGLTN